VQFRLRASFSFLKKEKPTFPKEKFFQGKFNKCVLNVGFGTRLFSFLKKKGRLPKKKMFQGNFGFAVFFVLFVPSPKSACFFIFA